MNGSPLPPEPPDGDGGGGPPSYLELLSSSGPSPSQQAQQPGAAGSSTAGSGGGSEISEERLTEVLEEPVTEEPVSTARCVCTPYLPPSQRRHGVNTLYLPSRGTSAELEADDFDTSSSAGRRGQVQV